TDSFFFQAEDGIRDGHVTGVQTCALPILLILVVFYAGAAPHFRLNKWALENGPWLPKGWYGVLAALPFALWVYLGIEQLPLAARSEERRVGKECRCRGWGERYIDNDGCGA